MPNPRAAGSTYNKRSFAMVLDFAVTKTEPTISPSFSAIQHLCSLVNLEM
jgi:hypothetical protein